MFDTNNLTEEYFSGLDASYILEIKPLPFEEKVKCFRFFLQNEFIANTSVVSNLFMLINGIGSIGDRMEEDSRLFFKNLEEYVDIKLSLKKEITEFKVKLLEYYLGIIEGLTIKLPELKIHITNTYYAIFYIATPELISKIMTENLNKVDLSKVKPVFNAEELYKRINGIDDSIMEGFFQKLLGEI